jgi:heat-inducible transcriptional repressor
MEGIISGGVQQILTLAEPVTQERLSQAAAHLNGVFSGLTTDAIAASGSRSDALEQDIVTLITSELNRTAHAVAGEIFTDGLTNVLTGPEYAESDDMRRALRMFEERSTLQDLLARTTLNSSVGGLQVLIGGEGVWEDLRQCSMVLARYGVPGLATGMLGVLAHADVYARTIPTVRYVAGLLSDMVNNRMVGE